MPYINLDWDYSKGLDPNSSYEYFPWYCADCPFLDLEFEKCSSSDGARMVFFDCKNREVCDRLYEKIVCYLMGKSMSDGIKSTIDYINRSLDDRRDTGRDD